MKKLPLCFIVLLAAGASSTRLCADSTPWTGVYVGTKFGASFLHVNQQLSFDSSKVNNTNLYNQTIQSNNAGGLEQLLLGYGVKHHALYLGVEGMAEFSQASSTIQNSNYQLRVNQNSTVGGRVRVGYASKQWLLYGLGGGAYNTMQDTLSFVPGGIYANGSTMQLNNIASDSQFVTQLGAGVDYAFYTHWAAELEYEHVFYDTSKSINHSIMTFMNPIGTSTITTSANQVMAGIRYIF